MQARLEDPSVRPPAVAGLFYSADPGRLRADGFDVAIFELPDRGRGDIATSAAALGRFVDDVLAGREADAVDLVGHSQGGLVARDYVKRAGGGAPVDRVIGLGAPNHGTLLSNLALLVPGLTGPATLSGTVGQTASGYALDLSATAPGGTRASSHSRRGAKRSGTAPGGTCSQITSARSLKRGGPAAATSRRTA